MNPSRAIAGAVMLALVLAAACHHSKGSRSTPGGDMTFNPPAASVFSATVGVGFSQTINVTNGGTQPFVFTLESGPGGLTIAQVDSFSATLSGTPAGAGVSIVRLRVVDALNRTTFLSYQFSAQGSTAQALFITPTTVPPAFKQQTYTQFFSVTQGVAPFSWTLTGSPPPNLVFHPTNGVSVDISGVPVLAGSFSFTLGVTDSSVPARTGSAIITLNVQ